MSHPTYFDAAEVPRLLADYPLGPDFATSFRQLSRDALRARQEARFAAVIPAGRILVNVPAAAGFTGVVTKLQPSFTLGCGTYGGNSTTDNVSFKNLQNIKRLAYPRT